MPQKMLIPLKHFYCDTCNGLISGPEDGWLEWISDLKTSQTHSYRICHHAPASPLRGGCYAHDKADGRCDNHLEDFLINADAALLSHIDPGVYHQPEYLGSRVADFREFTEIYRRLMIPYYEQARRYWDRGEADGEFSGVNEIYIYTPEFLTGLIEKYVE